MKGATIGLLILSLLAIAGCSSTETILRADFNQYAGTPSDEFLNGPIPGRPEGDLIQNARGTSVVTDQALVDEKSARVQGRIDFLTANHTKPHEYRISWRGLRTFVNNTGDSRISFLDDNDNAAIILVFDGGIGHLRFVSGTELAPTFMLGSLGHQINLVLDTRGLGRTNVRMQQDGDELPRSLNNLAFLNPSFDKLTHIRLEGDVDATYWVNHLNVIAFTDGGG